MSKQILLNLSIAFVWMFLNNTWATSTFIVGYLIGMSLILMMRRFLPDPLYFGKAFPIMKLILLFIKELIMSCLIVAREVVRPQLKIRPGIIAVPTELKSDWEITIFTSLVTLTPGTLTLEVSPNGDIIYIHTMDIDNKEEVINSIKNSFEKAIMEVSR